MKKLLILGLLLAVGCHSRQSRVGDTLGQCGKPIKMDGDVATYQHNGLDETVFFKGNRVAMISYRTTEMTDPQVAALLQINGREWKENRDETYAYFWGALLMEGDYWIGDSGLVAACYNRKEHNLAIVSRQYALEFNQSISAK